MVLHFPDLHCNGSYAFGNVRTIGKSCSVKYTRESERPILKSGSRTYCNWYSATRVGRNRFLVRTLAVVARLVERQMVISRSCVRTIARRQVSIMVEWIAMSTAAIPRIDRLLIFIVCSSHHLADIRSALRYSWATRCGNRLAFQRYHCLYGQIGRDMEG
jgi:hypothetical protein